MRFLIDENLAVSCAVALREANFEAVHVAEVGLTSTADEAIVAFAIEKDFIIITFDLDFSRIVALSKRQFPSVISLRMGEISVQKFQEIISESISDLEKTLQKGALVTIDPRGVRIQQLPVRKNS